MLIVGIAKYHLNLIIALQPSFYELFLDIYAFSEHAAEQKKSSDIKKLAQEMSSWYDPRGQEAVENDVIRCFTYIQSTGFCMRTNTIGTYCEANRQVDK